MICGLQLKKMQSTSTKYTKFLYSLNPQCFYLKVLTKMQRIPRDNPRRKYLGGTPHFNTLDLVGLSEPLIPPSFSHSPAPLPNTFHSCRELHKWGYYDTMTYQFEICSFRGRETFLASSACSTGTNRNFALNFNLHAAACRGNTAVMSRNIFVDITTSALLPP